MDAIELRKLFSVLHWSDRDELERNGVIQSGSAGDKEWHRFNYDLTTFVLKLPADRLAGLVDLVAKENA